MCMSKWSKKLFGGLVEVTSLATAVVALPGRWRSFESPWKRCRASCSEAQSRVGDGARPLASVRGRVGADVQAGPTAPPPDQADDGREVDERASAPVHGNVLE